MQGREGIICSSIRHGTVLQFISCFFDRKLENGGRRRFDSLLIKWKKKKKSYERVEGSRRARVDSPIISASFILPLFPTSVCPLAIPRRSGECPIPCHSQHGPPRKEGRRNKLM